MKIIIISTDESAFYEASDTRRRFEVYARVLGEAHFIVIGRESHESVSIEKGSIVSAHGKWRIAALWRVYRVGSKMEGIEIISAQDPFEQGFIGWLIAKRLKAKLHLQIHTDIGSPYFAEGIKNKIRVRIARFLLPRADAIRTVSERVKAAAVRQFGAPLNRVSVLPIRRAEKYERCATRYGWESAFPQYDSARASASRSISNPSTSFPDA